MPMELVPSKPYYTTPLNRFPNNWCPYIQWANAHTAFTADWPSDTNTLLLLAHVKIINHADMEQIQEENKIHDAEIYMSIKWGYICPLSNGLHCLSRDTLLNLVRKTPLPTLDTLLDHDQHQNIIMEQVMACMARITQLYSSTAHLLVIRGDVSGDYICLQP